jgi:hypothetical protein
MRKIIGVALAAVIGAMAANAQTAAPKPKAARAPAKPALCEAVSAVATGFGAANVTTFANGNLDLAIDSAKNRLADKGAKGFSVRERKVRCENYIDFGGAIGKEHKCTASAQLCGKV